jgi:hypothetical protein
VVTGALPVCGLWFGGAMMRVPIWYAI